MPEHGAPIDPSHNLETIHSTLVQDRKSSIHRDLATQRELFLTRRQNVGTLLAKWESAARSPCAKQGHNCVVWSRAPPPREHGRCVRTLPSCPRAAWFWPAAPSGSRWAVPPAIQYRGEIRYTSTHFGSCLGQKDTPTAWDGRPPRPPRPGYLQLKSKT